MECGPLQVPSLLIDFRQGFMDMPEARVDSYGRLQRFFHRRKIAHRSLALRHEQPLGSMAAQFPELLQQVDGFQITPLPMVLVG